MPSQHLNVFVFTMKFHSNKSTFSSYIPSSSFLTRQLTLVTAGFIGIHFFRVVQQPPKGAAKSTLRPETAALTPWLPLPDSSPHQSLSCRHLLINNRSAPAMAGDLFYPEQPWRAHSGEGCRVEVKEEKILSRKPAPWPWRPGSQRPHCKALTAHFVLLLIWLFSLFPW